jgi:hypothetical protein
VPSNLPRFKRWIKGLAQAIRAPQRIEMTVQTDQLLIIRRRRKQVWCQQCGREVDAVSLQEAGKLAGATQPVLPANAESEAWHICTGNDGEQLVCLKSLLKAG